MYEFIDRLIELIPATSIFRSGAPIYIYALNFPLVTLEGLIFLHLAWQSIGIRVPIKASIIPSAIQSVLIFLARQILPMPFHILIMMITVTYTVLYIGKVPINRAIIATSFTESVLIVGTLIFSEPLTLIIGKNATASLLRTPIGFFIGTFIEALLPLIVLIAFLRYDITLINSMSSSRNVPK